jgi:hypothetical protein
MIVEAKPERCPGSSPFYPGVILLLAWLMIVEAEPKRCPELPEPRHPGSVEAKLERCPGSTT